MEEERRALAAFVTRFDALGLGTVPTTVSKLKPPMPTPGGAMTAYERRQSRTFSSSSINRMPRISDVTATPESAGVSEDFTGMSTISQDFTGDGNYSPVRGLDRLRAKAQPSLFDQAMPEEVDMSFDELEVENQLLEMSICVPAGSTAAAKMFGGLDLKESPSKTSRGRGVFGDKENILPVRA